ncbi:MAG TPA: hypothetical protein VFH59_01010 [Frateuria sp.]|uniref:hypothetical protein n=1 Tax=Frateuria sp. TaxID=2211372 RepID=UPI002D7EB9E3|nr:hypothetical protein [Frateuria sp.]HET6804007.1 hypothetical protein [Frateuria sp.]
MAGAALMEWCRQYFGEACDPRWLGIAREAGPSVTPGHVAAIMWTLKECASKARPRGSVAGYDAQAISDFYGWSLDSIIRPTVAAIEARGIIVDGHLANWDDLQPVKHDRTNAARQQAYRDRQRVKKAEGQVPAPGAACPARNGVTSVTSNESREVTTTEEKEQSNCSFSDSSRQDTNTSLKSDTSRTVRERGCAIVNPGEFWGWAEAHGIPTTFGLRRFQARNLSNWIVQGITDAQLGDALGRAQAARAKAGSQAPVNLGYLACFVDEVLSGEQPRSNQQTGGGNERGDELSREFARVG